MKEVYRELKYTVIFTTISFFIRDYKLIIEAKQPKILVFYWAFDINYFEFLKSMVKKHKAWAILERFEKINLIDFCINFGLSEVQENSILQIDKSWIIVEI